MRAKDVAHAMVTVSFERLLFPEPVPAQKNFLSWMRATNDVVRLDEATRRAFCEQYLPAATDGVATFVQLRIPKFSPENDPRLVAFAMLGAAAAGTLPTFVKRRSDTCAHELAFAAWQPTTSLSANPIAMALSGQFLPVAGIFLPTALEYEFAGADLYVRKATFARLIKMPAGSESSRNIAAKEIIDEFVRKNPRGRMSFGDFKKRMKTKFPGATNPQIYMAFKNNRPPGWEKGGKIPG